MQQAVFDQSAATRVARLDLTKVMAHFTEETGLTGADAARAEDLYRKFLTLVALNPGQELTPNRLIDSVWHTHITLTRQYMADCDMLFGYYLHHNVGADAGRHVASIAATQAKFEDAFALPMSHGLIPEDAMMSTCGT